MMNNYIKALSNIIQNLEEFKDLIDAATSKKPQLWGDGIDTNGNIILDHWDCPNCDETYELDYNQYNYCPNCGQAIDWTKEDTF